MAENTGTISLYDTRTMLSVLEHRKAPKTFLRDTFFGAAGTGTTFNTEAVDFDIIKGYRRLAPFVSPVHEGKLVEARGFSTKSYKPAYVKPKATATATDILNRQPGNVIYSSNDGPQAMAARQLGRELADMDDMIIRREEWMCAQALLTGTVNIVGEGVNDVIDYMMEATHLPLLVGTAKWTDHANATPLTDLKVWKRLVTKDSGFAPTICVMGLDAYDNFMKCEEVIGTTGGGKNLFNMDRIRIGELTPGATNVASGVTEIGRLNEIGVDVFTYEEWYIDEDSKVERPMFPANLVLLGNPNVETDFLYGAIKDLDALAAVARFPKAWSVPDPSARFIMLQSAPLPLLKRPDGFLTATVVD